jgi:hypothetical protein
MAKRKAATRAKSGTKARKRSTTRRSAKRPTAKRSVKRQVRAKKKAPRKIARKKAVPAKKAPKPKAKLTQKPRPAAKAKGSAKPPVKVPRLDRARRTLDDSETSQTPPSSLDMDRHGSAARTGRAEIAENIREHHGMSDVTGGDPDVNIEDAYFAGEEAPGGDNPTPDQDIVEDIGKALGVTYEDSEELKGSDKVVERDKHRWELDPASAEDYKERK